MEQSDGQRRFHLVSGFRCPIRAFIKFLRLGKAYYCQTLARETQYEYVPIITDQYCRNILICMVNITEIGVPIEMTLTRYRILVVPSLPIALIDILILD